MPRVSRREPNFSVGKEVCASPYLGSILSFEGAEVVEFIPEIDDGHIKFGAHSVYESLRHRNMSQSEARSPKKRTWSQ